MAKPELITGLDMGSGRISCLIASRDPETEKIKILGGAMRPCRGLRGGVVVNIAETARAVAGVIETAEKKSRGLVQSVILGVRGPHLETFNNHGAYNIARTDKEITLEDVNSVIENAKAIPISSDREIIHVVPQGFSLDRQRGVPNPVGMEGSLLEVDVHVVTASGSHLNNLVKSVNQAGFEVTDQIYSLLVAGDLVVTPEERELGCLLIDFGGQTVSMAVYAEDSIRFSKELSLGSDYISRDVAYGLRTSLSTAQRIKEEHGAALTSSLNGEDEITFTGVDGRTANKIKTRLLVEIIQPRVEEIFGSIREELQNSGFMDQVVPGGAILTGGGALLKGVVEAAADIIEMPVRLGLPQGEFLGEAEPFLNPAYATALGLVASSGRNFSQREFVARKKSFLRRKLSTLFEDIF